MAKGRLQSVKNIEGDLLKIAGIAVLGGVGIYALIKSAPVVGDLFTKGLNNIIGGIVSGLPSFGSGSTGSNPQVDNSPTIPGTAGGSLGGSQGITINNVTNALKDAGLPPAPSGTEKFLALGAQAETNSPGVLDQAIQILTGKIPSPNLATHPDLKTAENALVSQLSQSAASELMGQTVVGLYQLHGKGAVLPLTQNAVDYYNQHHIDITEITHY